MADPDRAATLQDCLLKALLDQEQMGVGVCDSDGALVMVSPALEAALGARYLRTPDSAWAGHYHLHDEHGRPLSPRGDPLARALRGEQITDEIVSVRRPDTPVRWIRCSAFPLRDANANATFMGAAVFVVDVTTRFAERRRLDELRDRLVETVNHQVRTPLATMIGHLELIEPSVPELPEPVQWSLRAMTRAAERLAEVVRTISDLADESQTSLGDSPTR